MTARNGLIAFALIVVLSIAFYFLAWSPLDEQQTTLEAETAALDSQAQQLRNQLAQLQQIRDSELQIRADLNRLRSLIPADDPAQPSFVRATQLAADASGVAIQSLTFGVPTVVDGGPPPDGEGRVLAEISLNGVVEGGYFQIVDLFRRMEIEVVRAVQIDTVGIAEGTDGFPNLAATVTGRVFTLLPVAQIEAVPEPLPEGGTPEEGATEQPADGAPPPPAEGEELQ